MISFLHGKLVESLPTQVIIEANGVGYEALIPLSSYDKLPAPGQEVKLLTHLAVREDAHTLYGFMTPADRAENRPQHPERHQRDGVSRRCGQR